ncbi:hypothetical protein SAMN05421833_10240 [Microbispora rosea]|uniref:Uncharacterized protein n=2 Tax=Microbispora rosea TaxID=58117 RepID=A0A1N6SM87_9ACTN|nr:hypothetical protein SAMN05421833_10240 [Microbispora rosea]
MWPAPVGDPGAQPGPQAGPQPGPQAGAQPGGVTSWPYSGNESQWPQGSPQAGTGDTVPAPWTAPPGGAPAGPGAFGASPSPYDDGSQGGAWQGPAGSPAWSQPGGPPPAPAAYGPDQQNAGGPWAAQPGETAPGVPTFGEWGPAPAPGQPSGGEAWSQAPAPHQGYPPAAPPQYGPQNVPQYGPQNGPQYMPQPGQDFAPAHPEAYRQGAVPPEAIRPGEPGDVPVWPPRLPGEPYPQGELPAGTSWPPTNAYQDEPGTLQASEGPSGDRAGTGGPGGTSGDALNPTGTPEHPTASDDPTVPGQLTAPDDPAALGHVAVPQHTGAPGDAPRHAGMPAGGGSPAGGPGQPDALASGGSGQDAPASYPAAPDQTDQTVPGQAGPGHAGPGQAGPPEGFGAEIAHAVTPVEGLPLPGTPYEPGQALTHSEQSTPHSEPQHPAHDRTTQPLLPPQHEEPFRPPTQTSIAPGQAQDSAPYGTPLGRQDEAQGQTASPSPSQSPSAASPSDVPPSAAPPGAAPSDTPPPGPSASDGATGADSPDPSSGQMATTSPTTGSPSQPTGETPFAFTPVTPAKAGKPTPPPGFGPDLSTPGNLPARLDPAGSPPSGGKVKRILMAAGAVVVVGAIGTAAYFAYSGEPDGDQAARTPTATTAAPPPSDEPTPTSTVSSAILDSEQTDPKTLKPTEAFPDEKVTLAGRTYRRVTVDVADDCGKAAVGAFAQALAEQQCRRVLRATYVDGKRQYAVTAGIAVLPGKTEALAVDQAKDLGTNVWFRGLDGDKKSRADKVTISGGYAAGMVWGRYIVFSYATYADGHTPDANDKNLAPISGAFRDNMAKVIEKRASR